LTGLDRASLMDELRGASERIQAVTGRWPLLLRPPYVLCDEAVLDAAGEIGMPWTVCTPAVPPDWLLRSAEEIANAVMVRVKRGAIISLHDGRPPHATPTGSLPTREATARAIDIVLENVSADYQ